VLRLSITQDRLFRLPTFLPNHHHGKKDKSRRSFRGCRDAPGRPVARRKSSGFRYGGLRRTLSKTLIMLHAVALFSTELV
jgi:hypothetical protein